MIEKYIDQVVRSLNYNAQEDKDAVANELRTRITRLLEGRTDETAIEEVLTYLGDPHIVSEEYEETHFLIGPRMYKSYIKVLKIMLKVVLIVSTASSMIATLISNMLRFQFRNSLLKIIQTLPSVISWILYMVVFVTAVFVIIERYMKDDTKVIIDYISNFQFKNLYLDFKKRFSSREDDSYFSKITTIIQLCICVVILTLVVSYGLIINQGLSFTGIIDTEIFHEKKWLISIVLICFIAFNSMRLVYKKWDTPMAVVNVGLMFFFMYAATNIYQANGLVNQTYLNSIYFWLCNEKTSLGTIWPDLLFGGYLLIMLYAFFVAVRGVYRVIASKIKQKRKDAERLEVEGPIRKRYRLVRDENK